MQGFELLRFEGDVVFVRFQQWGGWNTDPPKLWSIHFFLKNL